MDVVVQRFDVFLIARDLTVGSEIQKTRPCLVVSPDEMNAAIATLIVAPLTMKEVAYPTRVVCRFEGKHGQIMLDQLRTVDKRRLIKRLGRISPATQQQCCACWRKCSRSSVAVSGCACCSRLQRKETKE